MLKNVYLDAKIGVDPAETEPSKEWRVGRLANAARVVGDDGGRAGDADAVGPARELRREREAAVAGRLREQR